MHMKYTVCMRKHVIKIIDMYKNIRFRLACFNTVAPSQSFI